MSPGAQQIIRLGLWSLAYWIVASLVIALVSLRTCGMTPDSVAECDLRPLDWASALALGGYFIVLFLLRKFARLR